MCVTVPLVHLLSILDFSSYPYSTHLSIAVHHMRILMTTWLAIVMIRSVPSSKSDLQDVYVGGDVVWRRLSPGTHRPLWRLNRKGEWGRPHGTEIKEHTTTIGFCIQHIQHNTILVQILTGFLDIMALLLSIYTTNKIKM